MWTKTRPNGAKNDTLGVVDGCEKKESVSLD